MAINASLRFFGPRSPALQQRPGVAASRWKRRQQAAVTLQVRQCVGRSSVALGGCVEQTSSSFISDLNTRQKKQVSLFVDALLDWNQRMNLTAVTERDAVMERHIADSLALLPIVESAYSAHCCSSNTSDERLKVVDVGSGAGLPGLILAIARPAWQVTLLESLQKRCSFLEYAAEQSGLLNVTIVRARAEDFGRDKRFRECYDVSLARAVAEMRVLLLSPTRTLLTPKDVSEFWKSLSEFSSSCYTAELCLPLVRVGGLFVAAKGSNPQQEVEASKKAIRVLGASLLSISTVASEGPLGLRTAVVCHKQKITPEKYPRSPGIPGKLPL